MPINQNTIFGLLYCNENTETFKQLLKTNFIVYYRVENTPKKDLKYFIKTFNVIKHNYNKFVIFGHSYGAYFCVVLH